MVSREVWPEYNTHGDNFHPYWERLLDEFPEFQFVLYDDGEDQVIAEGHTAPCDWDGTPEGLGEGIDVMLAAAFKAREERRSATALCALAAEIRPRFQGRGLANRILEVMAELARNAGLTHLIAPVRPSFKDRYPITPIEQPEDRGGALEIGRPCPRDGARATAAGWFLRDGARAQQLGRCERPELGRSQTGWACKPGSIVWFAVTVANSVGRVDRFVVRSNAQPTETLECLPPGAKAPLRCVA